MHTLLIIILLPIAIASIIILFSLLSFCVRYLYWLTRALLDLH